MKQTTQTLLAAACAATVLYLAAAFCPIDKTFPIRIGTAGTRDFAAFWSAAQVYQSGADPYLAANYCAVQSQLPGYSGECIPFRSPPWMLSALSPIFALPFERAAPFWFALNVLMALVAGRLIWQLYEGPESSGLAITAASLLFFPHLNTLYWGQLGLMLTFASALFLTAAHQRRTILFAAALVLMSFKPHPIYLLFLATPFICLEQRSIRGVLFFAAALAALLWTSVITSPGVFQNWLENFSRVDPFEMHKPVLGDFIRSMLGAEWLRSPLPNLLVTLASLAGASVLLRRGHGNIRTAALVLLPLSLVTAPYAWLHDFSILEIVQVALTAQALRKDTPPAARREILLSLAAFEAFLFAFDALWASGAHQFIFIPIVLGAIALRALPRLSAGVRR